MGKLKITLDDLFNLPTAVIYNPDGFKSVSKVEIDSRKISKGCLFVAIEGEKFDGHDFVSSAVDKGASAVIINKKKIKKFKNLLVPIVAVNDTTNAYGSLANAWRKKLNAKVISITGSNGKTTTKEMIATLLSQNFSVVKTLANNNNHIGVPLTIFSANKNCDVLILEQGTNHFGEIEYTAKISQPDISIITNIGDSHLEFFKNRDGVFNEKSALLEQTKLNNGLIFINSDDPYLKNYSPNYSNRLTFGFNNQPTIKGKILGYTDEGKLKLQINKGRESFQTELSLYGEANAKNFLIASAIAMQLGLSNKEIIQGSKKLIAVHGRMEVRKYSKAFIIDDTYNSSPLSVECAVKTTEKMKVYKKKLIILGDIFELGANAKKIHKSLAEIFRTNKDLVVLTIGNMMQYLTKELNKKNIKSIHFKEREALSLYLQFEEIENSVILVKGSRGMKMEEFVNILEKRFE